MSEGRDIGDSEGSIAERSVSGYDEAIMSLGFMVRSMNFDLKIAPQTRCFSITSKPKSLEIPLRPPRAKRLPSSRCIESAHIYYDQAAVFPGGASNTALGLLARIISG